MINHVAFVMDGNRRWAKKQGFAAMRGHARGVKSIKKVIEFCLKKGIRHLSLYAFSLENFKRSEQEKSYLFNLLSKEAEKGVHEYVKKGIRVRFVGDRSLFPAIVRESCEHVEQETAHLDKLNVNLLFCYGGRQELVDGVKKIARKVKAGEISEDAINETFLGKHLWCACSPDPELIVRTGGVQRLSNFLLYQSAYSELHFLDCFWPEITMEDLERIYKDFVARDRRFGK